jgi:hypothetical protein
MWPVLDALAATPALQADVTAWEAICEVLETSASFCLLCLCAKRAVDSASVCLLCLQGF